MPTKDTKVVAARVPIELAEAMKLEAGRRGQSVNEMLLDGFKALYRVGKKGQEITPERQETTRPSDPMGWGTPKEEKQTKDHDHHTSDRRTG